MASIGDPSLAAAAAACKMQLLVVVGMVARIVRPTVEIFHHLFAAYRSKPKY